MEKPDSRCLWRVTLVLTSVDRYSAGYASVGAFASDGRALTQLLHCLARFTAMYMH